MANEHAISVIHLLLASLWAILAYVSGLRRGIAIGQEAARRTRPEDEKP